MSTLRSWQVRVFGSTWLAYAAYYFCRKPFYMAKGTLSDQYGWDTTTLGFLGASYLIAYTVGQFVAGAVGTRQGPRVLLLVGMGLTAIANMGLGFVDDLSTFGLLLAVNGLAQATGWSGGVGTMASWFRRSERGTVMGLWATNFQVGGVAASVFAAWGLGRIGFSGTFVAASWITLFAWAVVLLFQRNRPEDVGLPALVDEEQAESDERAGGGDVWTPNLIANVALMGAFYFFIKFIRYALWSWAPYLLETEHHLSIADAGYLSTTFDAAGIVGVIVAGVVSDRLFRGRRAAVSFLFVAAMAGACALLATLGRADLLWFGISIGLIGFSLYGPDALMSGAGAMDVGSKRQAVAAAGIINGMGSAGSVLQDLVLGSVLETHGSTTVFAILVGSAGCALACLGALLVRNRMGLADL